MKVCFILLKLEMKRMQKSIPYFLVGAIVLVLLAGTIAFSAEKMLYGGQAVEKIAVGVVLPKDDKLAAKALAMVTSLDSVGNLCEFQYVDENMGMEMLKRGTIFALMKVPEQVVQGIMNGTNTPITLILPERSGLEAAVFKTLTEAGASILQTSQAAIYATDELLWLKGKESSISQAEQDLNSLYLRYALSRTNHFRTAKVSAAGDVSPAVYYGISAAVLVLLLLGIPAAPLLKPYGKTMEQKLYLLGVGRWKRTAVRTICLSFLLLAATALPFLICFQKQYIEPGPASILLWMLLCISASGWTYLLYQLSGNGPAGILLVFVLTIVMLFLSGGFVPSVFLPESVSSIGKFTPAYLLIEGVKGMIKGSFTLPAVKLLLMELLVFIAASAVRRDYE